jgi:hypothetical protein
MAQQLARTMICISVLVHTVLISAAYSQTITPSPYWKNTLAFPDDPFLNSQLVGDITRPWGKFLILLDEPDKVYFQDSNEYPFHYDFATEIIDPFLGITPGGFNLVTLHQKDREAVLGAVIMPPIRSIRPPIQEYGIQLAATDAFTKEQVRDYFNLVKESMVAEPHVEALYFPTPEQFAVADDNRLWFLDQGIQVDSTVRWEQGNAVYSEGWALGALKYVPRDMIDQAYTDGLLAPGDILLTDSVPAEVPFVAAILTLSPSTPNSHVTILANNYRVPFVFLADESDAAQAQDLVGRKIVVRANAFEGFMTPSFDIIDVEDELTDGQIAEILLLKEPPTLTITPMATLGAFSATTDGLAPSNIQHFGGKATNMAILRAAIPDNSPASIAFSFDVWMSFLDQTLPGGQTLREEIDSRLAPFSYPPASMANVSAELSAIRNLFRDPLATAFSANLENAIIDTLTNPQNGFDQNSKIRFRSSTNVEDSEQFTGAGLYDSYSGCLADDLDGDDTGPSICDPTRIEERGVFRAIRRVFASFYNDNAYIERLRHGVNENEVGMAILVHHSFPDEFELANGVATLERDYGRSTMTMVTQLGALSVANPEHGSIPEQTRVQEFSSGNFAIWLLQSSNQVLLGDYVMDWVTDYRDLGTLLQEAAQEYQRATGAEEPYTLDFEYKKVAPSGALIVKQIRVIPQPSAPSTTPFLINAPSEICTFQGEFGEVFANHRLKSHWRLETKSMWLTPENLQETIFTNAELQYAANGRIQSFGGPLNSWPGASHTFDDEASFYGDMATRDTWTFGHLSNPRAYTLVVNFPDQVSGPMGPIVTLQDLAGLHVEVVYDTPVPLWSGYPLEPSTTTMDTTQLRPCFTATEDDILIERSVSQSEGISIDTAFYWPPEPTGIVAGYTAPLAHWIESTIAGFTSDPIIIRDHFAQSYRPEHHNFAEHFVYEPRLDPGVPQSTLDELRAQDIRLIYWYTGQAQGEERVVTLGFEDERSFGDINGDETVDSSDLQLVINAALGLNIPWPGDVTGDNKVDAVDVQLLINIILGL